MCPNGTYVAFHANRSKEPNASDRQCYNLIKAWGAHGADELWLVTGEEKAAAMTNPGLRDALQARLVARLRDSKHLLLIVGRTTAEDLDWVPFEIACAVDECRIPIIASYTVTARPIIRPFADTDIASFWPSALRVRIEDGSAGVIHIPFLREPLRAALARFNRTNFPKGRGLGWISEDAYRAWGIL
jgi:hypothetical protein